MASNFDTWWQKIRKPLGIIGIIAVCIGVVALVFVEVRLYGTGFVGKTLWDWLGLLAALAIPVVVGFGAAWFTAQQGKVSDRENTDNQRQVALQAYIDKMSELLLEKQLRTSQPEDEVRTIARVRTITLLFQLDARRIGYVFAFLREAGLMSAKSNSSIVNLYHADLNGANLSEANLSGANLRGAWLHEANLSGADLSGADLTSADLTSADLSGAHLDGAHLSGANLSEADLSKALLLIADLSGAHLNGANLSEALLGLANLSGADLSKTIEGGFNFSKISRRVYLIGANLSGANLSGADLSGANLSGANLSGATVTGEQLIRAKSLKGVTMPDGSKHP